MYTFFAVFLHEQTSPLLTFVGHSEVGGGGVLTHTGTAHLAAVGQTGVQNYHLVHSLAQLLDLDPEMKNTVKSTVSPGSSDPPEKIFNIFVSEN